MASPLECLPPASLTPSGLLELDAKDGEVELIRRSGMELRSEQVIGDCAPNRWKGRDVDLICTVTTHRLVFQTQTSSNSEAAKFLHLSNLHQAEKIGGATFRSWNASYKLLLNTYALGELILVFRGSSPQKDRDDFLGLMEKALQRRAWEAAARAQERQKTSQAVTVTKRKVGVDAIMAKSALRHKEAARLAEEALGGDAEQLLQEAAELVSVIQKYVATLQKSKSSGDDQDDDAKQLASMLSDMGITSALTKQDMGGAKNNKDEYHTLIARQLADFLVPKLKKTGGILTLTDVFCLFNRARGTNLISPEDLVQAMKLTRELNLQVQLREFPSGITVVQLDSWDDEQMATTLVDLCNIHKCVTSLDTSRALHTSPLLAQEHLLSAERAGYLCRDTTLETIRFYPNRFNEFVWPQ
jgi:ESCRT-II complex subunit VPS36